MKQEECKDIFLFFFFLSSFTAGKTSRKEKRDEELGLAKKAFLVIFLNTLNENT